MRRHDTRVLQREPVVAALILLPVGIGVATLWSALAPGSCEGLEAIACSMAIWGTGIAVGWSLLLGAGLISGRHPTAWMTLTIVTFALVAVSSGAAAFDTAQRVAPQHGAPPRHLIAPVALMMSALLVVIRGLRGWACGASRDVHGR